jgi:phytoene dehydrogenase-like protein
MNDAPLPCMHNEHVVIIGGGLAGLAAGCYARASGFRTTIVEHNLALGGVCTAWTRGPYTIDGCIHWLTGGPFDRLYDELEILPGVARHTIDNWLTYRDARVGVEVSITRDLNAVCGALLAIAPEDADEIRRLVDAAADFASMDPGVDRPPELATVGDSLARIWDLRHHLGAMSHFRKPVAVWAREHLKNRTLRTLFERLVPEDTPALFLLMVLGYLSRGYLSRPSGGTARFLEAVVETYRRLGGEALLHATVDEVLVASDRARGVRLADGTILDADIVISTASAPETVLRLLAGRYGAPELRHRMERWRLFEPIVLASFGVATDLAGTPPTLLIDGVAPFEVGGRTSDHLYVRIYNDDPSFAPPGHTVVQTMVPTDYAWWAKRGTRYGAEKDAVAETILARIGEHLPAVKGAVKLVDVATPLTYWNMARSWRGAYEGWTPSAEALFGHVKKTLTGLSRFYMAGQWVEPGGGVPTALMSGRQVVQLLCADLDHAFATPRANARIMDVRREEARARSIAAKETEGRSDRTPPPPTQPRTSP